MPPLQTARKSGEPLHQMITRTRSQKEKSKTEKGSEESRPSKNSIPKRTAKSSALEQKKSVARPRTVPARKKSVARPRTVPARKKPVARPRTAPRVSRARQPKKQSKIEKCGEMKHVKMETKCKNLQLKVADLRKENLSLKKQLSVFEEWRKSNAVLKIQNTILKTNPGPLKEMDLLQMIELGMDGDQIKAKLLKMGFSPSHAIWNEYEYVKKYVICSAETNDKETLGTEKPKDQENKGKCSKKMQQKIALQDEYDKMKKKLAQNKEESQGHLHEKELIIKSIEDKISKLQQREVNNCKEIQVLENTISEKKEKSAELTSKYEDAKKKFYLLGAEYSAKQLEHKKFKMNAAKCETCEKYKQEKKATQAELKGNSDRRKAALNELNEAHKQCAEGCRQGRMLALELDYLGKKVDATKQVYSGIPYVAESGQILLQEYAVRFKHEQREIESQYRSCLAKCGVPSSPLSSSSSSSSLVTSSGEERDFLAWKREMDLDSTDEDSMDEDSS